jgi:hypothetical protein
MNTLLKDNNVYFSEDENIGDEESEKRKSIIKTPLSLDLELLFKLEHYATSVHYIRRYYQICIQT